METIKQGKPVPCPVIDTHVHIGACDDAGEFQPFVSLEETIRYADDIGIDVLVTSPITLSFGDMKRTNDEAVEAIRAYPKRIYGNLFVSPSDGYEGAKATVDKYSKVDGFVAIKLLTGYFDELDHPAYEYVWAFAQEAQCPVACHIYGKNPSQRSVLAILKKYPDLKLILAHMGRFYVKEEFFDFLDSDFLEKNKDKPFWFDVSSVTEPEVFMRTMAREDLRPRLLFAADHPFGLIPGVEMYSETMGGIFLTRDEYPWSDPKQLEQFAEEIKHFTYNNYHCLKSLKDAVMHYIPDAAERKEFLENMFYYNACKVFGVEP
jgi:predicted TIM-barrel fold metal-dependent hydrolase